MTSTFTIAVEHPKHFITQTFRIEIPSYVDEIAFLDHVQVLFSQPFDAPEGDPTAWWDETQRRIYSIVKDYNAEVEEVADPFVVKAAY